MLPPRGNPPSSSREGAGRAWSSAVREAISRIEQKEVEAPGAVGLPQSLDLRYEEDFLERQRHEIPSIFSDPLFIPHMAKGVFDVVKLPVVLKALPSANSREVPSTPNQPGDGGPELEVSETKESTPSTSQPCQQVQEQISEASNTDSDKADEPTPEEEPPCRSLKVRLSLKLLKRDHKATTTSSKDGATPGAVGLPQSLDLRYEEDFLERQRREIPSIFSDPLFIPHMAKAVFNVVKPPVVLKGLPSATSHEVPSAPNQPGDGGPELEVSETKESTPSTSQPCQQVQEQISEASNTDSDKADEPTPEEEPPRQILKVRLPLKLLKHDHKATTTSSKDGATPSKVWKESEANEAEATTSTGPSEAALRKARFELYEKDLPEVQEVRAQLLGLGEGEKVTQKILDSSPAFHLRRAADETRPPTVRHVLDRPPRRRGSCCQVQTPRLQV